ncbi:hypothetical protein Acsp06_60690 [Actinomycetospora sp. NBRC 106375]|nr:hypothetical protein [Actinomycetospora sp. NBRC 106375]GLZ49884.1 hypothetical protein Acsp06_60690 [Actinomycetospora sp. NBRC 106375]
MTIGDDTTAHVEGAPTFTGGPKVTRPLDEELALVQSPARTHPEATW